MAITYFLATLSILDTRIAITRYLINAQLHMYDMVQIDAIVFEIVGGRGAFKAPPPPRIVSGLKYPGSDIAIKVTPFFLVSRPLHHLLALNFHFS